MTQNNTTFIEEVEKLLLEDLTNKKVCNCYCECHRDSGMNISHMQECCNHTYLKYLTKNGEIDKEACEKLGVIMIPDAVQILNSKL